MKEYSQFSVEDFAADAYFIKWVKNPTPETQHFWTQWIHQHPNQKTTIQYARQLVESVNFQQYPQSEESYQRVWLQIQQNKKPVSVRKIFHQIRYGVAASLLLLGFGLWAYYYIQEQNFHYATDYQDKEEIQLPDGSTAFLNANSSLRIATDWSNRREVWLDGEAFFSIKKLPDESDLGKRFIVHTSSMDVEVLGTQFNVNHRAKKTQVILSSGKVKLRVPSLKQEVIMKPGELVELHDNRELNRKKVQPEIYSAWRDDKLIFDNATLSEIKDRLETDYGYQVIIRYEGLDDEKFTGSAPANNLEVLFISLEATFGITIIQEGNQIVIEKQY